MDIQAHVMIADVPFLVGLDGLDKQTTTSLSFRQTPAHPHCGADLKMDREKESQLDKIPWESATTFSFSRSRELSFQCKNAAGELHRSLYHPSAIQSYELLRRSDR